MITNPPFRLKILKKITETIKGITPDNGFILDLSDTEFEKKVVRGRLYLGNDEPDTMVSIVEPPTSVEQVSQKSTDNPKRSTEWDILIQGWAKDSTGDEPCDQAYVLSAEVMQALVTEKVKSLHGHIFGMRQIENMQIGSPVVRPSEEVTDYGQFYIILTMKFVEDMARPFG